MNDVGGRINIPLFLFKERIDDKHYHLMCVCIEHYYTSSQYIDERTHSFHFRLFQYVIEISPIILITQSSSGKRFFFVFFIVQLFAYS